MSTSTLRLITHTPPPCFSAHNVTHVDEVDPTNARPRRLDDLRRVRVLETVATIQRELEHSLRRSCKIADHRSRVVEAATRIRIHTEEKTVKLYLAGTFVLRREVCPATRDTLLKPSRSVIIRWTQQRMAARTTRVPPTELVFDYIGQSTASTHTLKRLS